LFSLRASHNRLQAFFEHDQKDCTALGLRGHYARQIMEKIIDLVGRTANPELAKRAHDLVLRASSFYGGSPSSIVEP